MLFAVSLTHLVQGSLAYNEHFPREVLRPEGVDVEGEAEEGAAVDADEGRLRVEVTLAAVVQEGQLVPGGGSHFTSQYGAIVHSSQAQ